MAERNYSGPSPGSLQPVLTVSALDTTVVIDSLAAGTHYFAVTAIGDNGAESDFSSIENKMIPWVTGGASKYDLWHGVPGDKLVSAVCRRRWVVHSWRFYTATKDAVS